MPVAGVKLHLGEREHVFVCEEPGSTLELARVAARRFERFVLAKSSGPRWLRLRCEALQGGPGMLRRPFLLDSDEQLAVFLREVEPRCLFAEVWASVEMAKLPEQVPEPALLFWHDGVVINLLSPQQA
mmetsp:Transcript_5930/g.10743  ORF Transcript_5930/g.10743 Transcript_5930/m.10743 type:complete len:128 (-) Transcript_5930:140-523(-)